MIPGRTSAVVHTLAAVHTIPRKRILILDYIEIPTCFHVQNHEAAMRRIIQTSNIHQT